MKRKICQNLFLIDDDDDDNISFDVGSVVKSVVFRLNNCFITDVRLLLVVDFSSCCFEFEISFETTFEFVCFNSLTDVFSFL